MRVRLIPSCAIVLLVSACGSGDSSSGPPLPPVASAKSSLSQGQAPLTVNFDASKSSDPQSYALTYTWTFSDGGTATGPTPSHIFQDHGTYTAIVAVNDGHNTTSSSPITITVTPAPPTVQPTSIAMDVLGVAPTSAPAASISASDRENLSLTYSIATQAKVGTASVDATTGAVTYSLSGYPTATSDTFTVKVANLGASATATVTVALNCDPLLANQWHIQNTGQNAFATTLPVSGNDMNVTGAWASGYSGKGIKVGVADSGLEAAHEDLAANVDLSHSVNFLTGTDDPTSATPGFDHGTSVSGIIGAVAFNGKGGRGVAYAVKLRGYNLIAPGAFSLANMGTALGSNTISADNDLFNASFGPVTNAIPQFSGAYQAITTATTTLRGSLGATIVNAAGNDFQDFENASSPLCTVAQQYGVSCGDTATDERRGGYVPLIVAAIDAKGLHSVYSNTGSSVWISAPGGEYGINSSIAGTGYANYDPAIITTSGDGCANTEYGKAVNALDDLGANPLAPNCQYTAVMNGTSAATPNVSGVVAMMLEANPNLSVRDIKYILAKSAKRVDPTFAGVTSTNVLSGNSTAITLEQGWTTNAAGYTFSNRYGFGAVDASAAVAMAKTYAAYLPPIVSSTGNYSFVAAPPGTIAPNSPTGGFLTWTVNEQFTRVEHVIVFVNLASTPALPCNQIELKSPAGTKSILLHAANGFTNTAITNSRFESNAFYGEAPNGTWTLTFFDFCPQSGTSTALSTTASQNLLLVGH